jgi:uncharacterized protein YycO
MDVRSLQAFGDELRKIAGVDPTQVEALKKKLKPGDILVGGTRNPGSFEGVTGKALSAFQEGTPFFHSALYAGDGKIVDSRIGEGVHRTNLKDFANRYKLRALRVDTKPAVRAEAVDFAKKQVGKGYNLAGTLSQVFGPRKPDGKREREVSDSLYCSELIANAYHTVALAKDRHIGDVRPVDLQKSTNTRIIGELL